MTVLELKTPVTDFDDKPIKDINSVKVRTKKDGDGKIVAKTMDEIYLEAPVLTYGKVLYNLLSYQATPTDSKQSAQLHRYAVKIKNIMSKKDAQWNADENELRDVLNLLDLVPLEQGSQTSHGAVIVFIEEANKAKA